MARVQAEDQRLIEMVGGKAAAEEANQALVDYLGEHGVAKQDMVSLVAQNPVLQTAEARKTILEAAKYRAMMTQAKAIPARPVPNVQKPGTSGPRLSASDESYISLNRQLDSATSESQQLKIARKILALG